MFLRRCNMQTPVYLDVAVQHGGGGSRGLGLLAAAQAKGSPYLSLEAKKIERN